MILKKLIFAALLVAGFGISGLGILGLGPMHAGAAEFRGILLKTDQAHILRLDKPVKSVVIGNDTIADAVMQDAKTIVLTGRSNGVTNLIVMDEKGVTLLDQEIMVGQNDMATTRVFRGANVLVLSCTPDCEPKIKAPQL